MNRIALIFATLLGFVLAALATGPAFAGPGRLVPRFQLAKANVSYADFQKDRDDCVEQASVQKWTTNPGNSSSPVIIHSVVKFARCMQKKGYHSDPKGYDTGRLWEDTY